MEIPSTAKQKFDRAYDNVSDKSLPGSMSASEAVRRGTVALVNITEGFILCLLEIEKRFNEGTNKIEKLSKAQTTAAFVLLLFTLAQIGIALFANRQQGAAIAEQRTANELQRAANAAQEMANQLQSEASSDAREFTVLEMFRDHYRLKADCARNRCDQATVQDDAFTVAEAIINLRGTDKAWEETAIATVQQNRAFVKSPYFSCERYSAAFRQILNMRLSVCG